MVAAVGAVAVAAGADAHARAAAELADRDHQRLLQHAALVHVLDQRRKRPVEHRAVQVLQRPEVAACVSQPCFRIAVRDLGPVHLDETRAGLDQPRASSTLWPNVCRPYRSRTLSVSFVRSKASRALPLSTRSNALP